MSRQNNLISTSRGVSRLTMKNQALDPFYFKMDERSLADFLNYISAFSQYVRFVDSNNEFRGSWKPFFENNLAFILAEIAAFNVEALEQKLISITKKIDSKTSHSILLKQLAEGNYTLFYLIDEWYKKAKKDPEFIKNNELYNELNRIIKSEFKYHFTTFSNLCNALNNNKKFDFELVIDLEHFDPIWRVNSPNDYPEKLIDKEQYDVYLNSFVRWFRSLITLVIKLKSTAYEKIENILTHYPYHEPHISVLASFLKTFRHVQSDYNLSVKKHLDYYFQEVLQQKHRNPLPDRVFLAFDPADHVSKFEIEKGELLIAGSDDNGLNIHYKLDQDIELNKASIDYLKIVHVASNKEIGIGRLYKDVSNIYSSQINLTEDGWATDKDGNKSSQFLFGRDQSDLSFESRDMQQARLGFAISSSALLLAEGQRQISITFKFQLSSLSALISFVEEISANEQISADAALHKILADIFSVRLTCTTGWYTADQFSIARKNSWTDGEFQIDINLDISEPPVVAYNEEIHGENYTSKWPILEFVINSEKAMYSYSYIKTLLIESCAIEVNASGIKNIALHNDLGPIDISAPFFPFGSNSDLGSYFLVGCEEAFRKNVTDLSINIHWHNLPRVKGGFKSYYKEYGQKIDNDSFKIRISGLSDFQFHPKNAAVAQQFDLFEAEKKTGNLIEETKLENIDLKKINHTPTYDTGPIEDYSNSARTGFFKLELISPEIGFGAKLFPNLFSEAAIQNAKSSTGLLPQKEQAKVALPNEAFVPQIRSISLSYKANSVINFNTDGIADNVVEADEKIIHIHPFGNEEVYRFGKPIKENLIGQYDQESYLYIGFNGLELPAMLSLYFELEQNNTNANNHSEIPELSWWYLLENDWQKLEDSSLIFDSTNNFTASGIVQLKLPVWLNKKHQILNDGIYWISVRAEKHSQFLSKLKYVKTNGASATWVANTEGGQWQQKIAANTLSGFENSMPEIKGVFQPFASFGGAPAELDDDFYFRISERIKNKNRVVSPVDVERFVISNYANIFQVKCFTHTISPLFVKPGEVKVAVVPIYQSGEFLLPRMSYNDLSQIQQLLQSISTPFSNLQVINPIYESVKVSCSVQFEKSTNSGEYVKRLKADLRKFICPWFDEVQGEMDFGGFIDRSAVFSFVDALSYVKFVTGLSIVVRHDQNGIISLSDSAEKDQAINRIYSSAPWCVLVPDENHDIKITNRSVHDDPQETAIENMQVGSYFVISDDDEPALNLPVFNRKKDTFYTIEFDL